MVDRQRAQAILIQARDILADRMSELILESGGQFLEDAHGNSYMDEIGSVFESVGGRLSQVNMMLANLPAPTPATPAEEQSPASSAPGSAQSSSADSLEDSPVTFKYFAMEVTKGNLDAAAPALAVLFGLDAAAAQTRTATFAERLAADPNIMFRMIQLRNDLAEGHDNDALLFLIEGFGLTGPDGIMVLQHLKKRFGEAA